MLVAVVWKVFYCYLPLREDIVVKPDNFIDKVLSENRVF